jgi:hypothetical protein
MPTTSPPTTSLVIVSSYDPTYLGIFDHLVRSQLADGHPVVVLDISGLLATPVDSYHRGVLRALGLHYPGHDLPERMIDLGAEYLRAQDLPGAHDVSSLEQRLEEPLAVAVGSALTTYYRTDRPPLHRRAVRRVADGLAGEGRAVYRVVRRLLAERPRIGVAFVPNGRFPHQKLATIACDDAGIPTRHVEKGVAPNRAYVQDYAPQERLRSQSSVAQVLDGVPDERLEALADAWLELRAPAPDSRNEFSALWGDEIPASIAEAQDAGRKVLGIFTSSMDEFHSLGEEWHTHSWTDQLEAFDAILTRFEQQGYSAYLRVHPNLATKAQDYFVREREGVRALARRHPELTVIWHDAPANTYALMDASDAIVVWLSTVGLEASARRLPVWTSATTRYGLVADTRELLSPEALEEADLSPWDVDPHMAKKYIAYLELRDEDVTPGHDWIPWDSARPPRRAKLASIAVSGGTPGVVAAVRSLVDVYRHRSLRANLRRLRRG